MIRPINTREEIVADCRYGRVDGCEDNCYTITHASELADLCPHYEIEMRPIGGYVEWCNWDE
jgi:hypothetical protein